MPTKHLLRARVLAALTGILAALGLLEGVLWLVHPLPAEPQIRHHRFLPSWAVAGYAPRQLRFDPGPIRGVPEGIRELRFNRVGFLYPEAAAQRGSADEFRIAAIGGSTVECSALPVAERWPERAGRILQDALAGRPVTVLNLGLSAQDSRAHLATTCQHLIDLEVDVAVFMLGANDLYRAGGPHGPPLGADCFYPASRLSRVIKRLLRGTQIARHCVREPVARDEPYFAAAARRYRELPPPGPDVELHATALAAYARSIRSLAGVCKEHGILPVFATTPTMLTEHPSAAEAERIWGIEADGRQVRPGNFAALLDALDDRLLETCTAHGYPAIDLRAAVEPGLEHFYDQVHFTSAGAERVAAAVAESLRALVVRGG